MAQPTKTNRFLKGMIEEAANLDTPMPWARGARRQAMIARRNEAAAPKKQLARAS